MVGSLPPINLLETHPELQSHVHSHDDSIRNELRLWLLDGAVMSPPVLRYFESYWRKRSTLLDVVNVIEKCAAAFLKSVDSRPTTVSAKDRRTEFQLECDNCATCIDRLFRLGRMFHANSFTISNRRQATLERICELFRARLDQAEELLEMTNNICLRIHTQCERMRQILFHTIVHVLSYHAHYSPRENEPPLHSKLPWMIDVKDIEPIIRVLRIGCRELLKPL